MNVKNIVIIGSLSQAEDIDKLEQKYKLQSNNVWQPVKQLDKPFELIVKECYEKIAAADEVIAVRKRDGTFGEGTTYELIFAIFCHVNIIKIWDPNEEVLFSPTCLRNLEEDL